MPSSAARRAVLGYCAVYQRHTSAVDKRPRTKPRATTPGSIDCCCSRCAGSSVTSTPAAGTALHPHSSASPSAEAPTEVKSLTRNRINLRIASTPKTGGNAGNLSYAPRIIATAISMNPAGISQSNTPLTSSSGIPCYGAVRQGSEPSFEIDAASKTRAAASAATGVYPARIATLPVSVVSLEGGIQPSQIATAEDSAPEAKRSLVGGNTHALDHHDSAVE